MATYSAGITRDRAVETVQCVIATNRTELRGGCLHEVAVADRPVVDDLRRTLIEFAGVLRIIKEVVHRVV